jgi:holo-[acyl-carrier protein] synthase
MITGIGVDLIEIERVSRACRKAGFLKRYYTEEEIRLVGDDFIKAADNFAVKEAVSKMLGTGFRKFTPIDIEVLRDNQGKPYVNLFGTAEKIAKKQGVSVIHVSITNTKELASAYVIGEQ